ncbi:acetylornithine deacetylase, putative [Entamoeba invadens IP1]|uniref:acetylornithine deacetylase, putative n=1 Tax=Entamoeba invadens IP1 TaxID=370355 RepID=UPI0002C3DA25|nr:acetylornithine deacetylase, putative [Entamoeba invadens IP1]ELP94185.1 acetylornithine deacetylase, putative [Entamoeba invadens IP1]|eukprot:XP_004260956.1 acetylornithine deacetylase, putative [Entamoeba invadens IP1]
MHQKRIDPSYLKLTLKELVECNTQTGTRSDLPMISLLTRKCEEIGMKTETFPTRLNPNKVNFVAYFTKAKHTIVLSSHFDTVPIGDKSEWKHPPLTTTEILEENGDITIFGRGTSDMKGGIASQLAVLKYLHEKTSPILPSILLVVSCEEEDGVVGAKELVEAHPELFESVKLVLVDEPTNLDIGMSEKGELRVLMKCRGIAAHASTPNLGVNAINGMIDLIQTVSHSLPLSCDTSNQTTLSLGMIKGGSAPNVVADYCEAVVDIRTSSFVTTEEIEAIIRMAVATLHKTTRFVYEIEFQGRVESVHTDVTNQYVVGLARSSDLVLGKNRIKKMAYATDGAAFSRTQAKPTVIIFGPGDEQVIHKVNERISFSNLKSASEVLLTFLQQL